MRTFQVQVQWDGQVVAGVSRVAALDRSVDVITYREISGGAVKVPGREDTGPVLIERGVSEDLAFDGWASGPPLRKDVDVVLTDASDGLTVTYRMYGCWVSDYTVTPDLETGTVTEAIVLAVAHWERVTPSVADLAGALAHARSAQVRRVDLGKLMTGNTDKTLRSLDKVLREAQKSGAVLLFDEADALFAHRSDVQPAPDGAFTPTEADEVLGRLSAFSGQVLVVPPDQT